MDGDTLIVHLSEGQERPTDFDASAGVRKFLLGRQFAPLPEAAR